MKALINKSIFLVGASAYGMVLAFSLMSTLTPFLSIKEFPLMQFAPVVLEFLIPIHILAAFYFRKKSKTLFLTAWLALLSGAWVASKDIQYNQSPTAASNLSVLSYNIRNFGFEEKNIKSVANLINAQQPDVVCLQEFRDFGKKPGARIVENELANLLKMPYHVFLHRPNYIQGIMIYSRFPILKVDTLFMDAKEINNGMLVTLDHPDGAVGVANFHLNSFHLMSRHKDKNTAQDIFQRLSQNAPVQLQLHEQHLQEVLAATANYPYPLVLCADLNSLPHSRIAQSIRDRFSDSFLEVGNGVGWSFPLLGELGIRIDYQFSSEKCQAIDYQTIREGISDHYPIVGTYRF